MNESEENPIERDNKGRFVKRHSIKSPGRPHGVTLKEHQAERFRDMTPEQKDAYLKDVPKGEKWRMSEGNPSNNTDITSGGDKITFIPSELAEKYNLKDDDRT